MWKNRDLSQVQIWIQLSDFKWCSVGRGTAWEKHEVPAWGCSKRMMRVVTVDWPKVKKVDSQTCSHGCWGLGRDNEPTAQAGEGRESGRERDAFPEMTWESSSWGNKCRGQRKPEAWQWGPEDLAVQFHVKGRIWEMSCTKRMHWEHWTVFTRQEGGELCFNSAMFSAAHTQPLPHLLTLLALLPPSCQIFLKS